MIQEVTMYSIECDNCKKDYEDSSIGFTAFHSESNAEEYAENDGWYTGEYSTGNKHYCPECWETDEDDILVIKPVKS